MDWHAWAIDSTGAETDQIDVLVNADVASNAPRSPVLVNLMLDRSGSMKGAPLAAAVEAAQQFVELTRSEDYVGLVLFDGVAEQRVPVCAMDAKGKMAMSQALAAMQTGRGTALHQALELGAKGLQRILLPGRRARILLLTDGEPSVGPDSVESFQTQAQSLAKMKISVHALGLAKHYVPEILESLTQPSANAFEHVDGPEGLTEAFGSLVARIFGEVLTHVGLTVTPSGLVSLACRHAYSSRVEDDRLQIDLGDVSAGHSRRVLLTGKRGQAQWDVLIDAQATQQGRSHSLTVPVQRVDVNSHEGKFVSYVSLELSLVGAETAAWFSLARKDLERAEVELELAEKSAKSMVSLEFDTFSAPLRRHLDRLADLRLAVERGEGDIPLLIRRAHSAKAGTHVSQVIPIDVMRRK
jgi:Ca-activated chloride channel homolog